MAARTRQGAGTSLQTSRASYYATPRGNQRTVTYSGSGGTHMAGRQGNQVAYQSPSGQRIQGTVPAKTYHRVILAEFAACVILIAASPILLPRKKESGGKEIADATASLAAPLVRLTAVCILFFVLALMATGPRAGKVAAAFGGLVTLGALINATDMLTALAHAFTRVVTGGSSASTGGGNPFNTNLGAKAAQGVAGALGTEPTPTGSQAPGSTGNPIGEG